MGLGRAKAPSRAARDSWHALPAVLPLPPFCPLSVQSVFTHNDHRHLANRGSQAAWSRQFMLSEAASYILQPKLHQMLGLFNVRTAFARGEAL